MPIGPTQKPFTIAPTGTGPKKIGGGGQSISIIKDTAGTRGGGFPPDPSTAEANAAGVVLSTGNSYLLFSKDDGGSFTQVDPTTIFPSSDGGLCCDQVVVYDKQDDLFFWLLQYSNDASGNNRLRIDQMLRTWEFFDRWVK